MFRDFVKLSVGNLLRRGLRSWLTMIGIFLGIAAIVTLLSLSQGLRTTIVGQFQLLGTEDIIIQAEGTGGGPPGTGVFRPLTVDDKDELKSVNGVEETLGRIIEPAVVEHDDSLGFVFTGSFPEDQSELEIVYSTNQFEAEEGRLLEAGDTKEILVGFHLARDDDVFEKGINLRDKVLVDGSEFKVVGILKERGSFIIDHQIIMMEDEVRELYDTGPDKYDVMLARVSSGASVPAVADRIRDKMREIREVDRGDEDFTVETPESTLATFNTVLIGVQAFIIFIALISLVVGAIGIMNTMYTSVLERREEIGIMKSIGATNRALFTLFFIESGMLGLFGGLIGALVGIAGAEMVAFAGRTFLGSNLIQAEYSIGLFGGALLFSFVVGTLAGTLPAYNASKLNPVEALRK